MYKPETIQKYDEKMAEAVNYFLSLSDEKFKKLHVVFSDGDTKVPCLNVSQPPRMSCPNCKHCTNICYDIKACLRFPGVPEIDPDTRKGTLRARAVNYAIWKRDKERYFSEIDKKCQRKKKNLGFRWHQGGENIDYDYVCNMVNIAWHNPRFDFFWGYTKGYGFWNRYVKEHGGSIAVALPTNFHIMFSVWKTPVKDKAGNIIGYKRVPFPNPYGFPTYEVEFDGEEEHPAGFHCPGDCGWCMEHKRGCVVGESSWCHEH